MIEVSHLTKQYGNHLAVDDVSFTVADGQICGLLGPNGAGKSTIMNLLTGYLSATSGQVTVAGHPLPEEADAAKACVGYLPEQPPLYPEMTVQELKHAIESCAQIPAENQILIFRGNRLLNPDETLQQALQLSQAAEFVDRYPEKAAHPIAQLGRNVSGGQKQRLSIARALARRPEILIFDDSFSALDYKTDATLREGLAKQLPGTTKIIVAQRISTIRHADQILVLDRGEIAGLGTHDALMASCPVYREIAMSQLSEEELKKGGASK